MAGSGEELPPVKPYEEAKSPRVTSPKLTAGERAAAMRPPIFTDRSPKNISPVSRSPGRTPALTPSTPGSTSLNSSPERSRRPSRTTSPTRDLAIGSPRIRGPMCEFGEGERPVLEPEDDEGYIEYKFKLVDCTPDRIQHLISQMKFRLSEGAGECIYEIGVSDDGVAVGLTPDEMAQTLGTLRQMAAALKAEVTILHEADGELGKVAEILVRIVAEEQFCELRVAVVGDVDSGKSTLMGVLVGGVLDNGKGLARLNVFRHVHEVESGRTSSIAREIMGFNSKGEVVNYLSELSKPTWSEICEQSTKVVTFLDMAGHEKYLKTTIYGLMGYAPDYCMLTVSAYTGTSATTSEHLTVCLNLKIPVFIVVTKMDMSSKEKLKETIKGLDTLIKRPGCRKIPIIVKSEEDALVAAQNFGTDVCPIFLVSNTTGSGLDNVRKFLNLLNPGRAWETLQDAPADFQIDETFEVTDVGTVVAGTVTAGTIRPQDSLLLGPNEEGEFTPVKIMSIHNKRRPVGCVRAGQHVSFALDGVDRSGVKRGMCLVHPARNPRSAKRFEAEVLVLHASQFAVGCEGVVHCGTSRQTARVKTVTPEKAIAGMTVKVVFEFLYHMEFLTVGARLLFRDDKTLGIGKVAQVFLEGESTTPPAGTPPVIPEIVVGEDSGIHSLE